MKRPDDLTIKLHHDHPHYDEESGTGFIVTDVGYALWKLTQMWGMTHAEVVTKLANDAVTIEEEFVIDGEYIPPHKRSNYLWPADGALADAGATKH